MAKVIKMVENNVNPKDIPYNHDPLTLIIKDALVGLKSKTRMFVNISPSKFDTAVTNRSFKFAKQTGKIKFKKVNRDAEKKTLKIAKEREDFFYHNNLKLLKCSPADEQLNYDVVNPNTVEDINELLQLKDRNHINIEWSKFTFNFKYKNGKSVLAGEQKNEKYLEKLH